jgi:hypothetical protein
LQTFVHDVVYTFQHYADAVVHGVAVIPVHHSSELPLFRAHAHTRINIERFAVHGDANLNGSRPVGTEPSSMIINYSRIYHDSKKLGKHLGKLWGNIWVKIPQKTTIYPFSTLFLYSSESPYLSAFPTIHRRCAFTSVVIPLGFGGFFGLYTIHRLFR